MRTKILIAARSLFVETGVNALGPDKAHERSHRSVVRRERPPANKRADISLPFSLLEQQRDVLRAVLETAFASAVSLL